MITLKVVSNRGAAPVKPVAMGFDLQGGTIGRGENNKLILADPTVSRVHGQIVNRQGTFIIISRGRNPLIVDDVVVEAGDEVPLRDGAHVQIGEFLLEAHVPAAAASKSTSGPAPGEQGKAKGEAFGGL